MANRTTIYLDPEKREKVKRIAYDVGAKRSDARGIGSLSGLLNMIADGELIVIPKEDYRQQQNE
jgi:hypothetical protein